MTDQNGQATVEWIALVLALGLAFGGLAAGVPAVDGRSFGGFLAHRLVCAVRGGCQDGERLLARAYGSRRARLVREHAPGLVYEPGEAQLPVDPRRCRSRRCADAPDDRDLDAHRTHAGERATVFTRLVRRGGRTYVGYWLYYPDSNTTWGGSDSAWEGSWVLPRLRKLVSGTSEYPGFHRDDWEGHMVRIDPDGSVWARSTSHGHWQSCKQSVCRDRWMGATGWTRVSRGSHSGHIPVVRTRSGLGPLRGTGPGSPPRRFVPALPGRDLHERTTTAEGLRLVPLETLNRRGYRRLDPDVAPPWEKEAYRDPQSDRS